MIQIWWLIGVNILNKRVYFRVSRIHCILSKNDAWSLKPCWVEMKPQVGTPNWLVITKCCFPFCLILSKFSWPDIYPLYPNRDYHWWHCQCTCSAWFAEGQRCQWCKQPLHEDMKVNGMNIPIWLLLQDGFHFASRVFPGEPYPQPIMNCKQHSSELPRCSQTHLRKYTVNDG